MLLCGAAQSEQAFPDVGFRVTVHIARAVAAAQVQHLRGAAQGIADMGDEIQHDHGRALKHVLTEDLGAHMAVIAQQLQMRHGQRFFHKHFRLTRLDGDAELGIDLSRRNRLVGVRVDAGGQTQKDFLADASFSRRGIKRSELFFVIHDEYAHTERQGIAYFFRGLVVAVEVSHVHRKTGGLGGADFAGGDDVYAQALLGHDLVDPLKRRGLAGVDHQGVFAEGLAEGVFIQAAVGAYAVFVHEIQRRAVFGGQIGGIRPREAQPPRCVCGQIV